MKSNSFNLLLVLLIALLSACGPDTLSNESGENDDDETPSFDNDLQASTFETCQVEELIIGTWYQDEISNEELTFYGDTVTFMPDGRYDEYARESETGILAHITGIYSVISSSKLKI